MKRILNGLAVLLICIGLSLGIFCSAEVFFPGAESIGQFEITEEEMDAGAEARPYSVPEIEVREPDGEDGRRIAEESEHDSSDEAKQTGRMAYGLLDTETQKVYQEMLDVINSHAEEGELSAEDEELLPRAFEALTSDHGEIFWISGYRYVKESLGGVTTSIRFQPSYTMGLEQREEYREQVERRAESFLSGLESGASDYEKVKTVYEKLCTDVRYNEEAAENQNILSVFVGGQSVCNGIAASAQYLLTRLNVPCMTVYGYAGGEGHAWNLAEIGGEPYFFDATWGNGASEVLGFCSYEYLNLTSEDLEGTHTVNMELELPECTEREANYYVKEGLYFESYERETAGAAIGRRYAEGECASALRFAQKAAYEQAVQELAAEGQMSEYCPGLTGFRYMENNHLYILTLCW